MPKPRFIEFIDEPEQEQILIYKLKYTLGSENHTVYLEGQDELKRFVKKRGFLNKAKVLSLVQYTHYADWLVSKLPERDELPLSFLENLARTSHSELNLPIKREAIRLPLTIKDHSDL